MRRTNTWILARTLDIKWPVSMTSAASRRPRPPGTGGGEHAPPSVHSPGPAVHPNTLLSTVPRTGKHPVQAVKKET